MSDEPLSDKHPDIRVCESCGTLINRALNQDSRAYIELQKILPRCNNPVIVEYIESMKPINYAPNDAMSNDTMKNGNVRPDRVLEDNTSGLIMSTGEVTVRNYHCSTLTFPSCEGYITLTNKRVIFHGKGTNSNVFDEVSLDSVSGISSLYGNKIRKIPLILGSLLTMVGLIFIYYDQASYGICLLIFGIVFLLLLFKKVFTFKIYSSKATGSPINIGEGTDGLSIGSSAVYSVIARPTEETDIMLREIGAIIIDLQTLGDSAIEKWSRT